MKKILVTGEKSYVGKKMIQWLTRSEECYQLDNISLRDEEWRKKDFSYYDVVLHVAGVAHIKETKKNAALYYKINRDLTYEIAQKAKTDGVGHLIFLSSMSVYGLDSGVIDEKTPLRPKSNYGKSKLQAEKLIFNLRDNTFKVSILRPPMIYGEGCKGNYKKLSILANNSPFFPLIKNNRSMIYIDNLCEFIKIIIDKSLEGIFFPQNKDYVCTSEMVKLISLANNKKIIMIKPLNILVDFPFNVIKKMFGDLVYDKKLTSLSEDYNVYSFEETVRRSESSK